MRYLRAFLVVSRYEFMLGGVFFLFFVSALASRTWPQFRLNLPLIALGTAVWYLSHLIGSQVNCLADYEIDAKYKRHLVAAVDQLGKKPIAVLIALESALALAGALRMCGLTNRPVLAVLWAAGWVVSGFYSLEPVRLKRRGFWNPVSLSLVLYILPILFGYLALTRDANALVLLVLCATGSQMFALILMNEVEDIPEDAAQSIETPFVRYGVWPISAVCLILFLLGAAGTLAGLALLIQPRPLQLIFVAVAACGQWVVARDLFRLARAARRQAGANLGAIVNVIRSCGGRNSLHFAILGLTIAGGSALSLN